jgi:hypothetical protein
MSADITAYHWHAVLDTSFARTISDTQCYGIGSRSRPYMTGDSVTFYVSTLAAGNINSD